MLLGNLFGSIFADMVHLKLKEQWMTCKHEKRPLILLEKICTSSVKNLHVFMCKCLGKFWGGGEDIKLIKRAFWCSYSEEPYAE